MVSMCCYIAFGSGRLFRDAYSTGVSCGGSLLGDPWSTVLDDVLHVVRRMVTTPVISITWTNVARANVAAIPRRRGIATDVSDVAQGSAHTLPHVKEVLERIADRCLELERRRRRRVDLSHALADTTRVQFELGFDPSTDVRAPLSHPTAWNRDSDAMSGDC